MIEHEFAMTLLILFLTVSIMLLYGYNLIVRVDKAIASHTRSELNYQFKMALISAISIIIAALMFYLSFKLMHRLLDLPSNFLILERLLVTVAMAVRAVLIVSVDNKHNPFDTKHVK